MDEIHSNLLHPRQNRNLGGEAFAISAGRCNGHSASLHPPLNISGFTMRPETASSTSNRKLP
jgi:hypothetical protein